MDVVAKIASANTPVSSGPEQIVRGTIDITPGDNIALSLSPDAVASYARDGGDLLIQLKSGETIRIADFYGAPTKASHLFLVDDQDQLVATDLAAASDGSVVATYTPQGAAAEFAAHASSAGAAAAGGGGLGIGAILGGVALAAGGVAVAAGSGGGSEPATSTAPPVTPPTNMPSVDTTAPVAATQLAIGAAGTQLSGVAEAGATVIVDLNGDDVIDVTVTAGADGRFTATLSPALTNGETVVVTVRDAAGNTSPPASVIATDTTAPAPAAGLAVSADGTIVTGSGEPGATVGIDTNGDGIRDATGIIAANGQFAITLPAPALNEQTVTVTVSDPAGNASTPATVIAPDNTAPAPATGVVIAPDGTGVSGTTEPGATVTIDTNGDGIPNTTVTAGNDGTFTAPITPPLTNGEPVTIIITDPRGNGSTPVTVIAPDITAPAPATAVVIAPDGASVSGSAEPGATITIDTNGNGTPDTTVTAGSDGTFTAPLTPPLTNGEPVTVIVTDPAGNGSAPVTIATPDTTAPAPATNIIVTPDGASISGSAEPGASVAIDTNGDGVPDTIVTADSGGNFTAPLAPPLTNGESVTVTVTDPAGNGSTPVTVAVPDTTAPAPANGVVITPDGTIVSGSAEPGATVTIDTNGDGIPDTTVTAGNDGTFTAPLTPPLTNGETVTVVVTDAAGNASTPVTVTAFDTTAPAPATGIVITPDGASISGTAEAGATVAIDTNGDGIADVTVTAGTDGAFTAPIAPALTDGQPVTVTVTDPAGNGSTPVTVLAPDAVPTPLAPIIDLSNGTVLTGTTDAGNVVTLTSGTGAVIGQVTADANGAWSFTPGTALPDGTLVSAVATNVEGETGPPAATIVDGIAPAAPLLDASNGITLSGTTEAGATVTLVDGSGATIGTTIADANGRFTLTPATPIADGTSITATATDAVGNTGPGTTVTVDAVAPDAPTVDPSNGVTLSGTAEVGSLITVVAGNGVVIGQTVTDTAGNWSLAPATPLADGTAIGITASDAVGNTGPAATLTIDATAPAAPTITPGNGIIISGTAEANSLVTLVDGTGAPIGQVVADAGGAWSLTPAAPLADGSAVIARATDAAGNVSTPAASLIDAVAPAAPVASPSNGTVLTGTSEAGATITLTDANGAPVGTAIVAADGNWTITPAAPLVDGAIVTVTASDAAGNASPGTSVIIDAVPPAAPVIAPSNGTVFVGTAEPASTVTLTAPGLTIGQAVVDANGNWTITGPAGLANATIVTATATDAAGNVSLPGSVAIDTSLPSIPVIDPTNGAVVAGTADAGDTVTVTDGTGTVIGQTVADAGGNWSITPAASLTDGTLIQATAQNSFGAVSAPATGIVDGIAPAAPSINPTNGTEVSGLAEAGATITLTDANGATIGNTIAAANGVWTITPPTPLADGQVLAATATDRAGNPSLPVSATVDAAAPAAPTIAPTNGIVLTGTAEVGATVTLADANGAAIGTVVANGAGVWTFVPATALANGVTITAVASDAAGNASVPASTIVDAIAPPAPTIDPGNGVVLTGTGEAGATIIVTDDNGGVIGQTLIDANGNWSLTPVTPIADGTIVIATATDAAGNISPPVAIETDAIAPGAVSILASMGTTFAGMAEAGALITLTDSNGAAIGQTIVDANGDWSLTAATPVADGTLVNATATDAAGNVSTPASIIVDAVAPAAPAIAASNGAILTGTAEAGSAIVLTNAAGTVIGTTVTDSGGAWAFTPSPAIVNGAVVTATAADASGNVSLPASVTIDTIAPATPTIVASDGTTLSGTAEADSTLILTESGGQPIGTTVVDGNGNWSFTPAAPLADDTIVNAVARDAAGNTSGAATTTIDAAAPPAPVIDLSTGITLNGTAEIGATITLTDGNGAPIGTTTVDANGNWQFTPASPLADGTTVVAVATDAVGNIGNPGSVVIDAIAPLAPVLAATNGIVIAGTAEAGATVTLTTAAGTSLGSVVADTLGNWTVMPATPLADGIVVNAVATDATGNVSIAGSATVDAVAPLVPILNSSNGITVTGTAEAGATITLTDPSNTPIGTAIAALDGTWTITPVAPLANNTIVSATATDAAGNTSVGAATVVDAIAPVAPVIALSNGTILTGTAEANATVALTNANGTPIGTTTADANGAWSFTPIAPLADATAVTVTATDAAGNTGPGATITVDAVAPGAPVITPSNGITLTGTAEADATITLSTPGGPLATVTADVNGNWAFVPAARLPDSTIVTVTATDATGNVGQPATVTVDAVAPAVPNGLIVAADGTLLTGNAEAGSQVRIVINGDTANPVIVTATVNGTFSTPLTPALVDGQTLTVSATDPVGNISAGATIDAPDLGTPTLTIVEAADGFINNAEIANGIQVNVALSPGADPGDTVTVRFTSTSGYVADQTHIVTVADRIAGGFDLTLTPPQGLGAYPEGSATVAAFIGAGPLSAPVAFTVDTIAPQTPVLSLLANILTIAGEPNSTLTVDIGLAGTTATAVVTADNTGLASLDLLADLNVGLSWNDLLTAQVSVRGSDIAGNESNIATVGVGTGIQPIVLDNFGLAVTLIPTAVGFSGHTDPGTTLRAEIVTPVTTVVVAPPVDSAGDFQVNLLGALGLTLSGLLNLGAGVSVNLIATDATGHDSARYGVALISDGLSLNLGQVTITGDAAVNIMSGTDGTSEIFNAGAGADLILKVGTGDIVNAGDGNDTIELTAINHGAISGGTGFDTILFADGIDINYNPVSASTWTSAERIDLGTGDSGSVLTLTSAAVNAVTDAGHVLQITGEANDTLNVVGAVDTGTDVTIGGSIYDVYTFGTATLQIEHNSVTVVH